MTKSLSARQSPLSDPHRQLELLDEAGRSFKEKIRQCGFSTLKPQPLEVFQMNIGYMCNQVCAHCHVDAGPDRTEYMSRETMQQCLTLLPLTGAHTLDITGGAPEMHPDFRWLVETAHQSGIREIIVRSNLTILVANKKYSDLPEFFAKHNVRVVSSLPYFSPDRTDRQRGNGVFDKSMAAMRMLNETGYGMPGSSLIFDLVYNPGGAFLPTDQLGLERAFRHHLLKDYQVHFHHLLALTNLPVSRFLEYLIASENFEDYMDLLIRSFNPATIHGLMCRNTISIAWDGTIYDCDFNQMLKLQPIGKKFHLSNFDIQAWQSRDIALSGHCYGCTAGAGSSCQGATV